MIKVAIITSTGGSVMNATLKFAYIQKRLQTVISDRDCGALRLAEKQGVKTIKFITKDSLLFSNQICDFFKRNPHDLVISFYTKLFKGDLLGELFGKFVNFHPSILPACPGMDGFGDTIKSGARFIGATVHLIDKGTDTGFPIIQFATPYNPYIDLAANRHSLFVAQCKMLVQIVNWYEDGRIYLDDTGRPCLKGGLYHVREFSPNLDYLPAIALTA